jgi:chromosome segregation ATPase
LKEKNLALDALQSKIKNIQLDNEMLKRRCDEIEQNVILMKKNEERLKEEKEQLMDFLKHADIERDHAFAEMEKLRKRVDDEEDKALELRTSQEINKRKTLENEEYKVEIGKLNGSQIGGYRSSEGIIDGYGVEFTSGK